MTTIIQKLDLILTLRMLKENYCRPINQNGQHKQQQLAQQNKQP